MRRQEGNETRSDPLLLLCNRISSSSSFSGDEGNWQRERRKKIGLKGQKEQGCKEKLIDQRKKEEDEIITWFWWRRNEGGRRGSVWLWWCLCPPEFPPSTPSTDTDDSGIRDPYRVSLNPRTLSVPSLDSSVTVEGIMWVKVWRDEPVMKAISWRQRQRKEAWRRNQRRREKERKGEKRRRKIKRTRNHCESLFINIIVRKSFIEILFFLFLDLIQNQWEPVFGHNQNQGETLCVP